MLVLQYSMQVIMWEFITSMIMNLIRLFNYQFEIGYIF